VRGIAGVIPDTPKNVKLLKKLFTPAVIVALKFE
jgi:hypothetical protein